MGTAPSPLKVIAIPNARDANIMDSVPITNIGPFAMCHSLANPTVAAMTAAAMGVLTPAPCVPATHSTWVPGDPANLIQQIPALTRNSCLMCSWAGMITITG
jgi:hypothetical protein